MTWYLYNTEILYLDGSLVFTHLPLFIPLHPSNIVWPQIQPRFFLFSTFRESTMNKKDLQALTLVGPIRDYPVLDPLAVYSSRSNYICHHVKQCMKLAVTRIVFLKFQFPAALKAKQTFFISGKLEKKEQENS